jgi:GntR family transcriptional regulator
MSSLVDQPQSDPSHRQKRSGGKSERVRRHVLDMIDSGLEPHDRLPTERELAEQLGVSRLTLRRVLDELAAENRIYRIQGSGTFVRPTRISKSMELTSFSEDMRSRGMVPGSLEISVSEQPAGAKLAAILELTPGSPVVSIRRVRTADGAPMCVERSQLPAHLVPGLTAEDVSGSLYDVLAARYGIQIDRADQTVRATVLDPDDAGRLGVPAYSAAFEVDRIAVDNRSRPVEHAMSLYRGDRYSYELSVAVAKRRPAGPVGPETSAD